MATWDEFARLVRAEPGHIVERDDEGALALWYPDRHRQYVTHQLVGGMEFVSIETPIGRADAIDLYRAFQSVTAKLCGLAHFDDQIAIKLVVPLSGFDLSDWRWPLGAMNVYYLEVTEDCRSS